MKLNYWSTKIFFVDFKHYQGRRGDGKISRYRKKIRDLAKEQKAQKSSKDYLGVIIYRNLPCRRKGIGSGNGELSPGGSKACKEQEYKLLGWMPGMKILRKIGL